MIDILSLLARANLNDTSGNLPVVMIGCGAFLVCAVLAFIPIRIARNRSHFYADAITGVAILWALAAAGSIVFVAYKEFEFAAEQNRMMASGFLDLAVRQQPPTWPWPLWIILAVAYGLVLFFATRGKSPEPPAEPPAD
jgi:hypothetical protein